jgi:hypothetical protein
LAEKIIAYPISDQKIFRHKQGKTHFMDKKKWILIFLLAGTLCLSACSIQATPTATSTPVPPTETFTPEPTLTPTITPTRVPPELPIIFTTSQLNPLDTPHTYIQDTCTYLKAKWDPNNSVPGTVVMVIMVHSISKSSTVTQPDAMTGVRFQILARDLNEQGFTTITVQQLYDFLDHNARIPPRSFLFIVDDNRTAENYNTWFRPLYEQYGWTVTNAIISDTRSPDFWSSHAVLEAEGWLDHQAHGVVHNINITPSSSDDFIKSELYSSIQGIQEHFNKTPIAYIWPGGGFTERAVEIAVEAGYKLGFTINPRGPLMFNWLPLADQKDPNRPSYLPEGSVSNLLMVLPRYWSPDADNHIDQVRVIGQEAAAYAEANKQTELDYYDIVCVPLTGPLPTLTP